MKSSVHCTPYLHEINFNTLLLSTSRSLRFRDHIFLFSCPMHATCIAYLLDLFICLPRRTNYRAPHYTNIPPPFFTFSFLDQIFSETCFQETLCFRQYKKNVWPFVTVLATKPFIGFLMQFGVGIHHRRLNKREFRENRRR